MKLSGLVRWFIGGGALLAAGAVAAASIVVTFPYFTGLESSGGFPLSAQAVGATQSFAIPHGERVVSATISGAWGSPTSPLGTAGVDVLLDGVLVAQCVKPDPGCWVNGAAQRPWSHTLTAHEMAKLNDGSATLSVQQTSESFVSLGASTLIIATELPPTPTVPALSPLALLALLAAVAVAGGLALRRFPRA